MKFIIRILILVTVYSLFSIEGKAQEEFRVQSLILSQSNLRINGTSNVNDFECVYTGNFGDSKLNHSIFVQENLFKTSGDSLALLINSFDCGKRGINRDFRNTLKSKEFPHIVVHLLSVKKTNNLDSAYISIELAGVSKEYTIAIKHVQSESENLVYKGFQSLRMTDFNIEPPTALLGLVKVRDELIISFELVLDSNLKP